MVAPVSASMRRFCPVSLTTRRRSATGLKSTPNSVPLNAVNASVVSPASATSVALSVATPEVVLIVYRRPVLPSAYNSPGVAPPARTSRPTTISPACKPVIAIAVSSAGSARSKVTRRPVLVTPNVSPEVTPAPGAGTGAGPGGGGGGGGGGAGAGGGGAGESSPPPPQPVSADSMRPAASKPRPTRFVVINSLCADESVHGNSTKNRRLRMQTASTSRNRKHCRVWSAAAYGRRCVPRTLVSKWTAQWPVVRQTATRLTELIEKSSFLANGRHALYSRARLSRVARSSPPQAASRLNNDSQILSR